jgi:hypothetical protein
VKVPSVNGTSGAGSGGPKLRSYESSARGETSELSALKLSASACPSGLTSDVSIHILPVSLSLSSNGFLDLLAQLDVCLTTLQEDLDDMAMRKTPADPLSGPDFESLKLNTSRGMFASSDDAHWNSESTYTSRLAGAPSEATTGLARKAQMPQTSRTAWNALASAGVVIADSRGLGRALAVVHYLHECEWAGLLLEPVLVTRRDPNETKGRRESQTRHGDEGAETPSSDMPGGVERGQSAPPTAVATALGFEHGLVNRMRRRATNHTAGEIEMSSRSRVSVQQDRREEIEHVDLQRQLALPWYHFVRVMEYARPLVAHPLASAFDGDDYDEEVDFADGDSMTAR